ncbi:MAG TPA: peptidoglycan bridge formation glycyltransferase FemA/FemB family protein [Herpetosiphonaceae bacterium]
MHTMVQGQETAEKSARSLAVIEHTDATAWDTLVGQHAQGHMLQSWAWGELKQQFGWQPLRVSVTDGAAVAAAQVLIRPLYGLSVAYVPRGPLFAADETLNYALLQTLQRIARRRRAAFLRLEPNMPETSDATKALHSWLQVQRFVVAAPMQPRSSIHLDLTPAPDALFAAFSKGHRADVRRAERNGVTVRVGTTDADLDTFYTIMQATGERQSFAIHARGYYQAALRLFGDAARLLIAEHDGAALAAFLVFGWGREATYMYSGSTESGLKQGANHLLQWHAIQWARERGCTIYDLWGIPDAFGQMAHASSDEQARLEQAAKEHPLYGVYRFKKGWGGHVVRYLPAYDRVYLAPLYWLWQRRRGGGE